MTLRKLQTIAHPDHVGFAVAIYRDSEWNEFRARLIVNGIADRDSDAFADTKDEAINTGRAMIAHAAQQRDKQAVINGSSSLVREAHDMADKNRLPLTICWIDGLCFRSIITESAYRFGIVTILPKGYFL